MTRIRKKARARSANRLDLARAEARRHGFDLTNTIAVFRGEQLSFHPRSLGTVRVLARELASPSLPYVEALRVLTIPGECVVVLPESKSGGGAA